MKDLSTCRVLIVDDVKANVDVLVQALRDDYRLSVALDGESALRSVEKSPPDLVLLDIVMPGLDGYEVCRRLRADRATQDIPVMFLSSLEEVKSKTRGFEVGGNDYLTKPFEILEVKARVHSLLKAKAYSDAVKQQMAAELAIARDIQLGILPTNIPARIEGLALDVAALLEPAREVGGDLYEVLRLEDGRLLVAVGDVSGKGIPAALFMAVTTTLLRTMARQHTRPAEILRQVNVALADQNPRGLFVTLACMIVDPATGEVRSANAGHPPAILLRQGQAPRPVLGSTGLLAGVISEAEFEEERLSLEPADTLLFYTDGVIEAFDAAGQVFGETQLLESLAEAGGRPADEALAAVVHAVRQHAAGVPASDDLTVVAVRRTERLVMPGRQDTEVRV